MRAVGGCKTLRFQSVVLGSIGCTRSVQLEGGLPVWTTKNPITHQWQTHQGHDIGCRMGEPLYAVSDGTVTRSGRGPGTGNVVIVEHLDGDPVKLETRYLHLLDRYVRTGDEVRRGQPRPLWQHGTFHIAAPAL